MASELVAVAGPCQFEKKEMRTPTDAIALMCTRNEGNENTDGRDRSDVYSK